MDKLYSTGQVAERVGVTPRYVKSVAQMIGLKVAKFGRREDWMWTEEQIEAISEVCPKRGRDDE
jgi:hypothetical protein